VLHADLDNERAERIKSEWVVGEYRKPQREVPLSD
jgi:hypothetical protein